jgi:OOP family OmpA-OmpF porin
MAAIGILAGCQTMQPNPMGMTRVMPKPGEILKVDQFILLADVTGSTGECGIFGQEKELVKSFVQGMPDMKYEMGFTSFAGVPRSEWLHVPLCCGNLNNLGGCATNLQFLGSLTPLERAVKVVGKEFECKEGEAALLIFSDGRRYPRQRVLDACKAIKEAHKGNLCIYTVNVGYSGYGKQLLTDMADATGCGHAWQVSDVNNPAGMEAMIREIFFKAGAPAVVAPAEKPKAQRTAILLNNVLFDFDKSVLKPEGKVEVDKLVAEMKKHPGDKVLIEGHTCNIGTPEYNMGLSQRRADSVKAYMLEHGVEAGRLATQAFGLTKPAVPNTDEANRKLNRRAEFKITLGD